MDAGKLPSSQVIQSLSAGQGDRVTSSEDVGPPRSGPPPRSVREQHLEKVEVAGAARLVLDELLPSVLSKIVIDYAVELPGADVLVQARSQLQALQSHAGKFVDDKAERVDQALAQFEAFLQRCEAGSHPNLETLLGEKGQLDCLVQSLELPFSRSDRRGPRFNELLSQLQVYVQTQFNTLDPFFIAQEAEKKAAR